MPRRLIGLMTFVVAHLKHYYLLLALATIVKRLYAGCKQIPRTERGGWGSMKLYCMPGIYALGPLIVPREFAIPASLLTAFQHVAARAARRPPRTDPSDLSLATAASRML
jgi:hypothetical protein